MKQVYNWTQVIPDTLYLLDSYCVPDTELSIIHILSYLILKQ